MRQFCFNNVIKKNFFGLSVLVVNNIIFFIAIYFHITLLSINSSQNIHIIHNHLQVIM